MRHIMLNVDGSMIGLSKKHTRRHNTLLENYLWKKYARKCHIYLYPR